MNPANEASTYCFDKRRFAEALEHATLLRSVANLQMVRGGIYWRRMHALAVQSGAAVA